MAPRVIALANPTPTLQIEEVSAHALLLRVRNTWDFPDCYTVGVLEGPAGSFGRRCVVRFQQHSVCDIDFLIELT
jgi:hypothetical protein